MMCSACVRTNKDIGSVDRATEPLTFAVAAAVAVAVAGSLWRLLIDADDFFTFFFIICIFVVRPVSILHALGCSLALAPSRSRMAAATVAEWQPP